MARIAVAGFRHETNSFAPTKATFADFEQGYSWPPLTRGAPLFDALEGYNLGLSGFVAAARGLGHTLVPLLWASASPSAEVTEDAYERIVGMILADLATGQPFDAVYLGLHGAMAAEHTEDGEGELLRRIQKLLGPDLPLVATLDYHANVTPEMVRHATALLGYRSYPHEDMAETGRRMARWLEAHLARPEPLYRALRPMPFLIPLVAGCTYVEPAKSVVAMLPEIEARFGVLATFAAGFPATDIRHCGPSVMAFGPDRAAVEAAVDAVASAVIEREAAWIGELLAPDEAVRRAIGAAQHASRPIVLADSQDNPGAGGTADTMGLLRALVAADAPEAALALVCDPHVATIAHRAGEGADIHVALGGKHRVPGDEPFDATFRVECLPEGRFVGSGPLYGGARLDLAPMCLLRIRDVRVVVGGKKVQAADQEIFRHVGIEPAAMRILALKSSVHFRGHFQPIAEEVLLVDAPGPMVSDPADLPFRRIRSDVRLRPHGPTLRAGDQHR
jgi:microcystin degradation protein MlrC